MGRLELAEHYEPGIVNVGAEGAYSAVVMDPKEPVSGYSDNTNRSSLPGEIMAHEFLGHFLGGRAAQSYAEEYDASIQSGNLYLQATGKSYYRKTHGAQHTAGFNPKAIPKYLLPH